MIIKKYCLLNSSVFEIENLSENSFYPLVLEQMERFEEFDGLPTSRIQDILKS